MYKSKVIKTFRCKNSSEIYRIGSVYESGNKARIRELMQKGFLEQQDIEEVETAAMPEDEQPFKHIGGGYYELTDGSKVKGKKNAIEASKK
ncbi:hypothetical protein [Priestia endophytica]|uniref:hypothetical protein n=1 Tax=Priestia endophytica TaxID=135735 RepID=UPI00203CF22E|nr:hypothetical protein [Priestia endophytica]MCM3536590.1 hypothetical protein [Priestia endophytica]